MSVHSVQNPSDPITIPDELESFLHVLLYLALRYLRSSLRCPGIFIDDYFASSSRDMEGGVICGMLKERIVYDGKLAFHRKPVTFLPDPEPSSDERPQHAGSSPPSPLNNLIADLLIHFKALYAVRAYNTAIKTREREPKRLRSLYDAIASALDVISYDEETLLAIRLSYGATETLRAPRRVNKPRPAPGPDTVEPSDEDKERAARLATHRYMKDLIFNYIRSNVLWPSAEHVGDRLGKRPWLESTVSDSEDEDEESSVEFDSSG